MIRYPTPLRYPGGKQRLGCFFAEVLVANQLTGGHYVEPFAGGSGVAMYLLHNQLVDSVHLNDIDRSIYAFWYSVTRRNTKICELIARTPITVREWDRQKDVQRNKRDANLLELGFSTLFLNRTNRSGILRAGMIGGRKQTGNWGLGARFNKKNLIERVSTLRPFARKISVTCIDARELVRASDLPKRSLAYLDPPYLVKSRDLYLNYYREDDHALLAASIKHDLVRPWILTYDNVHLIRRLYRGYRQRTFELSYTADRIRIGKEVMIASKELKIPKMP